MPEIDFFTLWRWMLALACTIYATIVLGQTAWSYVVWLSPKDRYTSLLRRYVVLHSLRVRARTFGPDLGICVLLCGVLGLMGVLHVLAARGAL